MRAVRWMIGGLAAGLLAGTVAGLLRGRRVTGFTPTYIPPEPARDHRAVGPHTSRRASGG